MAALTGFVIYWTRTQQLLTLCMCPCLWSKNVTPSEDDIFWGWTNRCLNSLAETEASIKENTQAAQTQHVWCNTYGSVVINTAIHTFNSFICIFKHNWKLNLFTEIYCTCPIFSCIFQEISCFPGRNYDVN